MARLAGRFAGEPLKAMNLAPMIGVLLAAMAGLAAASTGERWDLMSLEPPPLEMCKCKEPFAVGIDAEGRIRRTDFEGYPWNVEAPGGLDAVIAELRREQGHASLGKVAIIAHPAASQADVMRVYGALRAAGVERLQFREIPAGAKSAAD